MQISHYLLILNTRLFYTIINVPTLIVFVIKKFVITIAIFMI